MGGRGFDPSWMSLVESERYIYSRRKYELGHRTVVYGDGRVRNWWIFEIYEAHDFVWTCIWSIDILYIFCVCLV